jgi:hypothetical protein
MESKGTDSSSSEREQVKKKQPYSAPRLTDLGSIQQLSLAGVGPSLEPMKSTNHKQRS